MAELEDKLNAILSNPEAMGQIMSVAKALTGGDNAAPPAPPQEEAVTYTPVPTKPEPAQTGQGTTQPGLESLTALLSSLSGGQGAKPGGNSGPLGDLDPRLLRTAAALFSEYGAADDRKIALLTALKPFLKEERYAKMDRAIQIARLSRVIRVAFQLFKSEGGGDGV